nr:SIR2 family protein [Methylobacter sp. BlB1]
MSLVYKIAHSNREVVFLVGSALTAPQKKREKGVPGAYEIVSQVKGHLKGIGADSLEKALANGSGNSYQIAFSELNKLSGQDICNKIVQDAVLKARLKRKPVKTYEEHYLRSLEADVDCWHLTPGVWALGVILAKYNHRIGGTVLTTNFDPLIEIAIKKQGGDYFSTTLHGDGNIYANNGTVPHVIHLHGYWIGGDTLHSPAQLTSHRPLLANSLRHLLKGKLLVVIGYGGWQDVFTKTLIEILKDDYFYPEIAWCFYQDTEEEVAKINPWLLSNIGPFFGCRIHPFFGINIHTALALLGAALREKKNEKERESDLFWKMAEIYIRGFLGDTEGIDVFEETLFENLTNEAFCLEVNPCQHVCTSLSITPEMVYAIGQLIDGDINIRTEIILWTLRFRHELIKNLPKDYSAGDPEDFRKRVREMFFGKD